MSIFFLFDRNARFRADGDEDADAMPKQLVVILSIALAIVVVPAADSRASELLSNAPTASIVNGVNTQSRPTTAALLNVFGGTNFQQICTATLIGCETVLTAAHCVCPGDTFCTPTASDYAVYLQHVGLLSVSAVDVHPGYDFATASDIAVVTLGAPLEGVSPTPINTTMDPPFGTSAAIAGFGITQGGAGDSGLLREGTVETSSCSGSVPEPAHVCWSFVNPLGPAGVDSNTCSGDSGGPLFADLGGGEVVIGVTSGGNNGACLPADLSFDANVFQNATFIQSIGGPDLLNTTCGSGSQVGDGGTTLIEVSSVLASKTESKCRKELRKQYSKYVAAVLKAERGCLDAVNSGKSAGPCPDAAAIAKINKAASKVDAGKIGKKCDETNISTIRAAGACAAATSALDLATCILAAGDTAVATMLDVSYADDDPAGPIADAGEESCQQAVGSALSKYEKSAAKVLTKCQAAQDSGKVEACLDQKSSDKLDKAAAKVTASIASKCSDAQVAALDAASTFGGSCAGSATAADLAACQLADYDAALDTLVGLFGDFGISLSGSFTVPAGISTLRATLNGIEDGPNDIDLFIKLGAPPTTSDSDASSINGGVFEGIEIASPTAGTWHYLVDEFDGSKIPHQLTVTMFTP